jgi:hypothetical protein
VSLFGPKKPCPNCGHHVKEPDQPSDFLCPHCHQPGPWATVQQIAGWHAQQAARATYEELLHQLTVGAEITPMLPAISQAAGAAAYEPTELAKMNAETVRQVARAAVSDDLITPTEDAHLGQLMAALRVTWQWVASLDPELISHLTIAQINGGILPEVASPHLLAKKDEIVHIETNASLLKEVAVRQWQGGSSGFSIPLGKSGIRYRVGATRGHSVEVGTRMNVADTGLLAVTNKRVVYIGTRKTVDLALAKLVSVNAFSDGLEFHATNRVNAVIFQIPNGAGVVAAIVNAAAQRL